MINKIIGILLALVIMECLFQFIPLKIIEQNKPHHQLFCEYDAMLGWRHIPNQQAQFVTDEFAVNMKFNSKGIRGPEYSYQKEENEYRVLILGDSFAEGYVVAFKKSFSEQLKKNLNDKNLNIKFEVINAGVGGYSTDQQLIYFKMEGQKYKPDLVIVMAYFNDILANSQPGFHRGPKPFVTLDANGAMVIQNMPVPKPNLKDPSKKVGNQFKIIQLVKALFQHTLISNQKKDNFGFKGNIPLEYFVWHKKMQPIYKKSWILTDVILNQFNKDVQAVGAELLVFYVPEKLSLFPDQFASLLNKYGANASEWNVLLDDVMLESICEKNNIKFVNPHEFYVSEERRLAVRNKSLFFKSDEHWNVLGQKFTASLMERIILEKFIKE